MIESVQIYGVGFYAVGTTVIRKVGGNDLELNVVKIKKHLVGSGCDVYFSDNSKLVFTNLPMSFLVK